MHLFQCVDAVDSPTIKKRKIFGSVNRVCRKSRDAIWDYNATFRFSAYVNSVAILGRGIKLWCYAEVPQPRTVMKDAGLLCCLRLFQPTKSKDQTARNNISQVKNCLQTLNLMKCCRAWSTITYTVGPVFPWSEWHQPRWLVLPVEEM